MGYINRNIIAEVLYDNKWHCKTKNGWTRLFEDGTFVGCDKDLEQILERKLNEQSKNKDES